MSDLQKPRYDSYGFSTIPRAIEWLYGIPTPGYLPPEELKQLERPQKLILFFLIDALGWEILHEYKDDTPAAASLLADSLVLKFSSQFPSTTAAHVTTLYSGLEVGQTGIIEWTYYEAELDEVISALLFSHAREALGKHRIRETLKRDGVRPDGILPPGVHLQHLAGNGVPCCVFCPADYTKSSFNMRLCEAATIKSYTNFSVGLQKMLESCAELPRPAHLVMYFPDIDSAGHHKGPESQEVKREFKLLFNSLQSFVTKLRQAQPEALVVLAADHGQVKVDPAGTIWLDKEFGFLEASLMRTRSGLPIVPCGSVRDFFLFLKDEYLDEMHDRLANGLRGRADVRKTRDLIADGYFGAEPCSARFLANIGNLTVLPYGGESVFWSDNGYYECYYRGAHGGLTAREMDIPLICLPMS